MALPTAPVMLGSDDQAKKEYFDALQKTLTALDARANQGANWFQIAGQFLDPGKTGNFGESLGKVATTMGQQQERQADMQMPIAQMRAQIAGQKYEIENQSKALQMLSSTLGVAPDQVQDALSSGNLPPNATAKLAQIYPMVAQLSPKVGEIVKNTFSMNKDMAGMAQEDRKAGMGQAELVAKYGSGVLNLIPGGGIPMQPGGQASAPQPGTGAMAQPSITPSASTPTAPTFSLATPIPGTRTTIGRAGDDITAINTQMATLPANDSRRQILQAELTAIKSGLSALPPEAMQLVIQSSKPQQTTPPSDLAGLPLAAQADVAQKRVQESDKAFMQKRDEILNYTPQTLEASNTNLRQLDQFATKYPQIFGLMQQQGVLAGMMTAAQEGAQGSVGDAQIKLGLPVKSFLEKVKLKPEEQQAVRDVTRILGSEFLSNVRANKGLLGVNPTDNDARLLQAPMATTDDSSRAVQLWARQQVLLNKQREALYSAYQQHADAVGPAASPRTFFTPGSIYDKINKDYAAHRMQLFNQFHPK
jgi:hypothetical protein